jgi:hypothetical protein
MSSTQHTQHLEIEQLEERLRLAMLTSNVAELGALLHERLLFIGPDSNVYRKTDDLELHRSGTQQLTRLEVSERLIELYGTTGIVIVLAELAGVFQGQAFAGRYRYTRTWVKGEQGWQIVAGSVCVVSE